MRAAVTPDDAPGSIGPSARDWTEWSLFMWTFRNSVQEESPHSGDRSRVSSQAEGDMPSNAPLTQFHCKAKPTNDASQPVHPVAPPHH